MKLIKIKSKEVNESVFAEMRLEDDDYELKEGEKELDMNNPIIQRSLNLTFYEYLLIGYRNRQFARQET